MSDNNDGHREGDGSGGAGNRRTVLKAIGAGSTIPFVSGMATAGEDRGGEGKAPPNCTQKRCIHPFLGYSRVGDEDLPARMRPDHTVLATQRPPQHEAIPEDLPLEFFFDPVGLHVEPGDVVEFEMDAGHHTVTAYHDALDHQRRIPSDAAPFSSPVLGTGMAWLYRFETPGVYDLYCAPHETFGMVMRIVVGDVTTPDFGAPSEHAPPPFEFANAIFESESDETPPLDGDDVDELAPEYVVREGRVPWDALFEPAPNCGGE